MSTHNICFCLEIRKISAFFLMKNVPYLLLCGVNTLQQNNSFQLIKLLTSHPVNEKEVHGVKVSTRILENLTPQEVRDLRVVFELFDTNDDG